MKKTFALCVLVALVLQIGPGGVTNRKVIAAVEGAATTRPSKGAELAALEGKLLRRWRGPACGGDFTFKRDGTFEVRSFTPGQNVLGGTWAIRWDALPPTLLLTFKTSDFKRTYPGEPEYKYVGKTVEAKLLELDDRALAFRAANTEWDWRGRTGDEE
jgi:hypothetical protein